MFCYEALLPHSGIVKSWAGSYVVNKDLSHDMRYIAMRYVQRAKTQISLRCRLYILSAMAQWQSA